MQMNNEIQQRGSESPLDTVGPDSQSWASREDPDRKQEFDNEPEYKKQLYRIFSPRVAESFLQPELRNPLANPWIQQILERMGGQVTAEDLWQTIREDSRSHWSLACSQQLQGEGWDKWDGTRALKHSWHGVGRMHRAAQIQQGHAAAMLSANPLHDLNDSVGQEGPRRFLVPGLMTILTGSCDRNDELQEFNTEPKYEKMTRQSLTPTPAGINWDGKNYRFLTDGEISTIQPSAWWRHIKGEKHSELKPVKRAQLPSHCTHTRSSETHRVSLQPIQLKTIGISCFGSH
ncbi:uncharacterized protein LOC121279733 [Carcharodon carcharias]|uniref:uncharacterized protein LOC121279733 n=1 Tax=Carcharodon carcharias TaxID=13397 RepID=UPI001B7D96B1|nr:uncharacterized protein LOC121279733 [Carcharodon carcharias]